MGSTVFVDQDIRLSNDVYMNCVPQVYEMNEGRTV